MWRLVSKSIGAAILGGMAMSYLSAFADEYDLTLQELKELKAQYSEAIARIEAIEEELGKVCSGCELDVQRLPAASAAEPDHQGLGELEALEVYGDFLLRYESNLNESDSPRRDRAVMRGRLGADYQLTNRIVVGGLLETGDPDDPNSGYATVSEFANDFQLSLSRIFVTAEWGDVTVYGGKFTKPFESTDLLWDGDVNPTGVAVRWHRTINEHLSLDTSGLYFIVDESAGGPDSDMFGGQATVTTNWGKELTTWLSIAYYDYELGSVEGADAGDFRSNLLDSSGAYLSDYDLIDVIAGGTFRGFADDWPVSLVGDYVLNTGAAVDGDSAFKLALSAGSANEPGKSKFSAFYSEAEVDAVLAAFSNDNFELGSNYRAAGLGVEHMLHDRVRASASWYHYCTLNAEYLPIGANNACQNRVRMNLIFSF